MMGDMSMHAPFFHQDSGCVRFWVPIAGIAVGAAVNRETLQRLDEGPSVAGDPLVAFREYQAEIEDAVRRRVAAGAIEPVVIRDPDLRLGSPGS